MTKLDSPLTLTSGTPSTSASTRAVFPFAALLGQAPLQQALLLAAVDPGIGGVLVSGPRGTAKSTAARALAELLPDGQLVTLPLGASEERLVGTLDLEAVLRDNAVRFSPGLLAKAHRGVLYVDEINLLPDALVDLLLDVAASGVNTVERDGISHSHDARFVLLGTMTPEEGDLRPQLLDRFGLMVELENCFEPALRERIVKARLAFELDPQGFRGGFDALQDDYAQRIRAARERLPSLAFSEAVHARVSALCIAAAVDGMRADLVMLRAARALAALEQAGAIAVEHVDRVAQAALRHRRHAEAGTEPVGADATQAAPRSAESDTRQPDVSNTGSTTASTSTSPAERNADADWGYLPPVAAGIEPVKAVRPLDPKKH